MNVQYSVIWELILYKFKLGYKATKIICCAKDESTVDHNTVTRGLKKLCCKSLDSQDKSGRLKAMNSEAMGQAIEANPAIITEYQVSSTTQSS